ncbi:MAG: helix-turn-helix transcriptional regulator [Hydrogenophilaceae bacterium]|jgi:transcriptional regulator with XRE-family HTH domain|nr:helix-turn-helix transcriptional regulator [Hydrogenophilaceae bacterium]
MSALQSLGEFLGKARTAAGKTLRAVESETGISNAYLSQLENGKIKSPSPQNLHKLALCYSVSYELLMELAGFPLPNASDRATANKAARIGPLTDDEEAALVEYLQFIRSRKRGD